eukprot:710143-Pelagomonas_calceolata.AAC.1
MVAKEGEYFIVLWWCWWREKGAAWSCFPVPRGSKGMGALQCSGGAGGGKWEQPGVDFMCLV